MTDVVVPGSESRSGDNMRTLTHVLYALHTLSWFTAGILSIFSIIAMIVNYVKRPDLTDDLYRSHFRWQARSFWFALLWLALTSPLWFLWIPGMVAWAVVGLWALYRFVRGWVTFVDGRPMPV